MVQVFVKSSVQENFVPLNLLHCNSGKLIYKLKIIPVNFSEKKTFIESIKLILFN